MMVGTGNPLAEQVKVDDSEKLTFTDKGGVSMIGPTVDGQTVKNIDHTYIGETFRLTLTVYSSIIRITACYVGDFTLVLPTVCGSTHIHS